MQSSKWTEQFHCENFKGDKPGPNWSRSVTLSEACNLQLLNQLFTGS